MIVSVINGQANYGIDLSEKGAEIHHITMSEFKKIQNGLAEYDVKKNKIVDIPQVEIPVIIESEEEIEARELEAKIEQAKELVLRKLALQELEESTTEIDAKITILKSSLTTKATKKGAVTE